MDENTLKMIAQQLRKPEGDAGKQTGEMMNKGNKYMNEFAIEALQVKPKDVILEVGMGNGFFVKDIVSVDPSVKYTGCDFSELMIEEARKRNQEYVEKGQAQFVLASAEAMPFKDQTFNKIFTVNAIYFWESPEKVLKEFYRVLKPGGILIITLRPKESMQHIPVVKYGFNLYSEENVTELLFENGFTLISCTERQEPDQEIAGQKIKMESLAVVAEKMS